MGPCGGIGAANTVVFDDDQPVGYNTDYRAAMDSLDAAGQGCGGREPAGRARSALVLGAGGVARAITFGLKRRRASTWSSRSRTIERARQAGRSSWTAARSNGTVATRCTSRHAGQLHAGRHASQRRRIALRRGTTCGRR